MKTKKSKRVMAVVMAGFTHSRYYAYGLGCNEGQQQVQSTLLMQQQQASVGDDKAVIAEEQHLMTGTLKS